MTDPILRKTRIVCISDTHNAMPGGPFQLPKGDVLIHAGDLTNQGSYSELQKAVSWLEEADFEAKVVVAGNHDITLDSEFYSEHGLYFHNQSPQDPSKCQELFTSSKSITYLNHQATSIGLASLSGPHTTFKIFGSPMSPADGMWAFGYSPESAVQLWNSIPLDADIVITHTPPKYHLDERKDRRSVGCEALRNALWRVRPKVAICGHIHESRGAERIRWDLSQSNVRYKEASVESWVDPGIGNKKMSLVDLTRKGGKLLDNDGSKVQWVSDKPLCMTETSKTTFANAPVAAIPFESPSGSLSGAPALPLANYGHGGIPPSHRCDLEALTARMGRKETCVVNAAMMASSYPHGSGGKKYNKPIVVDIDLPVWDENCE